MISRVVLFCAVVAAARATVVPGLLNSGILTPGLLNSGIVSHGLLNSGIVAPGLLNSGIVAPGLLNSGIIAPGLLNRRIVAPGLAVKGAPLLSTPLVTRSVLSNPATIGTTGLLTGAPLAYSNGIVANGLIGGVSPVLLNSGLVSPLRIRSGGILAGPGLVKTILK